MVSKGITDEERVVGRSILAYLVDHPGAQDSVEGIVRWWLLEQKVKFHTNKVEEALAELVSEGYVVVHDKMDAWATYRVNPDKLAEIVALLEKA